MGVCVVVVVSFTIVCSLVQIFRACTPYSYVQYARNTEERPDIGCVVFPVAVFWWASDSASTESAMDS